MYATIYIYAVHTYIIVSCSYIYYIMLRSNTTVHYYPRIFHEPCTVYTHVHIMVFASAGAAIIQ